MTRIPKIVHFCFGMASDFGGKSWGLSHYVSVASAINHIRPHDAFIYYEYEPDNVWWELTKKIVTPVRIEGPREVFGNPVSHPAHRADVVRLQRLIELGGIYLDSDVVVHRSFDDLLGYSTVLGAEGAGTRYGTANAIILAEPHAPFTERWYDSYRTFRGEGRKHWNEHSVRLPYFLSKQHPDEVTILGHRAFFWPLWTADHLEWIFNSVEPCVFDDTFATHLWDGKSYRYTKGLTPGDVRRYDTNFHLWSRPYLEGLDDDFGAVSAPSPWRERLPSANELLKDRGMVFLRGLRKQLLPKRRYEQ